MGRTRRKKDRFLSAKPQFNPRYMSGSLETPCPSGKRGYTSVKLARAASKRLQELHKTERRLSPYWCSLEGCNYVHLGNLPQVVKDGEVTRDKLVSSKEWLEMKRERRLRNGDHEG